VGTVASEDQEFSTEHGIGYHIRYHVDIWFLPTKLGFRNLATKFLKLVIIFLFLL